MNPNLKEWYPEVLGMYSHIREALEYMQRRGLCSIKVTASIDELDEILYSLVTFPTLALETVILNIHQYIDSLLNLLGFEFETVKVDGMWKSFVWTRGDDNLRTETCPRFVKKISGLDAFLLGFSIWKKSDIEKYMNDTGDK